MGSGRSISGANWRVATDSARSDDYTSGTGLLHPITGDALHLETAQALASTSERWMRLTQWLPRSMCRAQPDQLTAREWRILHILPYTVSGWEDTLLATAPNGARATWYEEFPFLRSLCHGVVDHSDWSNATLAPTGQAWGESQDDDISSPESPRRN